MRYELLALALALLARPAAGEEAFQLKGFVTSKYLYSDGVDHAALAPLVPPLPASRGYFELNAQPRLRLAGRTLGLAADVSLYLATREPRPLVLINEGYVSWQPGALRVLVGRRRVVWGSGIAANPTDLIDPPKNLLEPEQQRTGAFLVPMLELVGERVTVSTLLSPRVSTEAHALPTQWNYARSIVGGRIYALLADTDLNLIAYEDLGPGRILGGGSLSRFLGESVEIHAEGLAWSGKGEAPGFLLPSCFTPDREEKLRASAVAGLRYDWSDQTFLSLEYLYQGGGLSDDEFARVPAAAACSTAAAAAAGLAPVAPDPVGHPAEPPLALLRRHYAVAVFQRPHLGRDALDDVALRATLVVGPADGSLAGHLRLTYKQSERAELGLGCVLAHSLDREGEFRQWPTRTVLFTDLKVYY